MTNLHEILSGKKRTKELNFVLLSWPKRKQIETTKKDSWCDITWCIVPLPKLLPGPENNHNQRTDWHEKHKQIWQIPYQGCQTLEILNVEGSFLQYPHPHINLPPSFLMHKIDPVPSHLS